MGKELKTNDFLQFAIILGCLRVSTSNRTNEPNIRANPEYIKLYKKANVKVSANLIEEKISSL